MKLQFPFKDYTDEEIMSTHGDERMRRLVANDTRTLNNVHFLTILFISLFAVGFFMYELIMNIL